MEDERGKSHVIKSDTVIKAEIYIADYNNYKLCLKEKLCVLEHSETNKVLNQNWYLSIHILTTFFLIYHLIDFKMYLNWSDF